jgi:hypothetical protein
VIIWRRSPLPLICKDPGHDDPGLPRFELLCPFITAFENHFDVGDKTGGPLGLPKAEVRPQPESRRSIRSPNVTICRTFAARKLIPDCPPTKTYAVRHISKCADLQAFRVDDRIRTGDRLDHNR